MRSIDDRLKASIQSEMATVTLMLKVTPKAGAMLGFTRHPFDLDFDGLTYRASPGMHVTALQSKTGLSVDNLDASGLLDDQVITESDVIGGKYDSARHELFIVDYERLDYGKMILLAGRVYELRLVDQVFTAQLGSLSALLGRQVGAVTSPRCRVKQFGDAQCGLDLSGNHPANGLPLTLSGQAITAITGNLSFQFTCSHPSGFFDNGKLAFTGGNNAGLSIEVKRYTLDSGGASGVIIVQEPLLAPFAVGDVFTVQAGCSRTYGKCQEYRNVLNGRFEPFIIGMRKLLTVR